MLVLTPQKVWSNTLQEALNAGCPGKDIFDEENQVYERALIEEGQKKGG